MAELMKKAKNFDIKGKKSKKVNLGSPNPIGYYRFSKEKDALDKK